MEAASATAGAGASSSSSSSSNGQRRRGSSWARQEGNMTSGGLTRRRVLAFAGLALVVGAIVGVAVTKGRAPAKAQVRACVALTADKTDWVEKNRVGVKGGLKACRTRPLR
jgi:hypothetical protein